MTYPQQHDDPFGEGRSQVLQALAVFATVGESAARFVAAGAQKRAAKSERRQRIEQDADQARGNADQVTARPAATQDRADHQLMDRALDPHWLATASIHDSAAAWRTAAIYAMSGDKRAMEAMSRTHDRLRELNPGLMDAYHRHRTAGLNMAEAMAVAARDTWDHQTRPATGRPDTPAADATAGLDDAIRAELARLAADADPAMLDQLERQWRSAGHTPAADAAARLADTIRLHQAASQLDASTANAAPADHLAEPDDTRDTVDRSTPTGSPSTPPLHASTDQGHDAAARHLTGLSDQQHRQAVTARGAVDLITTPVDEHRDGLAAGQIRQGAADHDQAGADQQRRLARAFPPLTVVTPAFSHAPALPPSQPPPTRGKGSHR